MSEDEGEFYRRGLGRRDGSRRALYLPSIMESDIDEARKEIFPLPKGDLPINPKTGQRDIIVLNLKDWLPFVNNLRKWFGVKEA